MLARTIYAFLIVIMFCACSLEDALFKADERSACAESVTLDDVFPFNDSLYPYAGIPRIAIETDTCEYDIEKGIYVWAHMRVYGKDSAENESVQMRIKGRGNSSWDDMPKRGYRIKLEEGGNILGMPKSKNWVLIANYADKSLMKNHLAYRIAADADMEFSPKSKFVELYLNQEYLGVYLLTESVDVEKNRIKFPDEENSYLVEFDAKYKEDEQVLFVSVLDTNKPLHVHYPKNASESSLRNLSGHIESFEMFLQNADKASLEEIAEWIDIDAFAKHFWIQEFAKNPDANYFTSVYFTWCQGKPIKMGPVWDFDLAFGGIRVYNETLASSEDWRTRDEYWNARLFSNKAFADTVGKYWKILHPVFDNVESIIDSLEKELERPAENNFKRWDILHEHGKWISNSVRNYGEAVNNLRKWSVGRRKWIDRNAL